MEKNFKNKFKKMIPNILTKSRFIAPFIIVPMALSHLTILALISTALFALTDAFDGLCARKFNAYSDYGRILDPICDKVFAIGITIPILITNPLSIITTIILEFGIAIINLNSSLKNNNPKSTYLGKFKTGILSISLLLTYLNFINIPIIVLTNIVQFLTAINYYQIDKEKDDKKNESKFEIPPIEFAEKNQNSNNELERTLTYNYEKEKNELIELKKSLLKEDNEYVNENVKKM